MRYHFKGGIDMVERWKKRVIQMNLKRAVLVFAIISIVSVFGLSVAVYGKFIGRVEQWEDLSKTEKEYRTEEADNRKDFEMEDGDKEYSGRKEEIELEQIWETMNLSVTDVVLIVICGIIGMILVIWYWVLCLIWAYRKASRMGVNSTLWVLATLFFNLASITVLYFYAAFRGTCSNCGRIKTRDGKYCDRCGTPLKKMCPQCGQTMDINADYCSNCGIKLNENEKLKQDSQS